MRLVTFTTADRAGAPHMGALLGDHIVDLAGAHEARLRTAGASSPGAGVAATLPSSMLELLRAGEPARAAVAAALAFATSPENLAALQRLGLAYPAGEVAYLPPIAHPGKIICLGRNYRAHAEELGHQPTEHPIFFAKFANTLIGHRLPIVLPRVSDHVDYEGELVVVIGRTAREVPAAAAWQYVAGFMPFNDVTVRDYQRRTSQWLQGKTFDGTGPIGPALVTTDEVGDASALDLTTRLNGAVMQQSNTANLIFDIPTIISYLSEILTLEPGDLIATGTPGGIGDTRTPPVWLRPGDLVEVEIQGLGTLANEVVAPDAAATQS